METAKHRIFVLLEKVVAPEHSLIVIARDDYTSFGILSSRIHVVWALALGGTLEDRPRYNSNVCFDTFPFPEVMGPDKPASSYAGNSQAAAIADAARELDEKRRNVLLGSKTTLTGLYNERPYWLDDAHRKLDAAVAASYGWIDYSPSMSDDEILKRLLALNIARSS